jgi:two-component system OmpR family sensor kinase
MAALTLGLLLGSTLTWWWFERRRNASLRELARWLERGFAASPVDGPLEPSLRGLSAGLGRLLAQIEEKRQAQRRLVADTSHELRNPLTVIRTNLDLLGRELEPQMRVEVYHEAEQEVERMVRLVEELMMITTLDRSTALHRVPVRLDVLASELTAKMQLAYPERVLKLSAPEELTVLGDRDKLIQIAMNLIENAARYTLDQGMIQVSLRAEAGQAVLEVRDNGIGIDSKHFPYLFDRFYRVDPARSRASGGTGLGLPIVQLLTNLHGGEVRVASQPGQGSAFEVRLPLE